MIGTVKVLRAILFLIVGLVWAAGESQASIGPFGGNITSLVVDPKQPSTIYAGTNGSGIFKSEDEGKNWFEINTGIAMRHRGRNRRLTTLAIDPNNPDTLFMGGGIIHKTTDAGATWSATTGGGTALAIDPLDSNTIYTGHSSGVSKSIDGGASWFRTGLNQDVLALAIDWENPNILYAGTSLFGAFKSFDGGETWFQAGIDFPTTVGLLLIHSQNPRIIYAATDDGLLRSVDGGATFAFIGRGLPNVISLAIHPQQPAILYAGTGQGVYKSTDGGDSFVVVMPAGIIRAVGLDSLDPDIAYAGEDNSYSRVDQHGEVFKTVDAGKNWVPIHEGMGAQWVFAFAVDPQNPETLYAGTNFSGLHKTTNRGETWSPLNQGVTIQSPSVRSLALDRQNPQTIYRGSCGAWIFKSTDGGDTWTALTNGLRQGCWINLAVDPKDSQTVYANRGTTDAGFFRSTDGGESWVTIGGLEGRQILTVAVHPTNSALFVGAVGLRDEPTLFTSSDRGDTWTPVDLGRVSVEAESVAFDPVDPDVIYVGASRRTIFAPGGIFKSTDGGSTWSEIRTAELGDFVFVATGGEPNTVYFSLGWEFLQDDGGIFKSSDGGTSWTELTAGTTIKNIGPLATDPNDPLRLYAPTFQNSVYFSEDGGETWR